MYRETNVFFRDGESLAVTFRDFLPADAGGVIACIKDEYGDTYPKQDFYREDFLRREHERENCHLLVAEIQGEIAAVLGLKRFLRDDPPLKICEWVTANVKKKYRKFGLMTYLNGYALKKTHLLPDVPAVYATLVTYQNFSQRSLESIGFVPTGFMFNTLAKEAIRHSFRRGNAPKYHHGLAVLPLSPPNPGPLFVPPEQESAASKIYADLGTRLEIGATDGALKGETEFAAQNDESQQSATLWLKKSGSDLKAVVEKIHRRYQGELQTFNAFLNCSEPGAVAAYKVLGELGYFFTGWRPFTGAGEYMMLHFPGKVASDFTELELTPRFREILNYAQGMPRSEPWE